MHDETQEERAAHRAAQRRRQICKLASMQEPLKMFQHDSGQMSPEELLENMKVGCMLHLMDLKREAGKRWRRENEEQPVQI